jgi:hypothetical protein
VVVLTDSSIYTSQFPNSLCKCRRASLVYRRLCKIGNEAGVYTVETDVSLKVTFLKMCADMGFDVLTAMKMSILVFWVAHNILSSA